MWYVRLHRLFYNSLNFNTILANNCNSHGNCVSNACVCNNGWGGDDCSVWDKVIQSGVSQSGHVGTFEWHYYHIDLQNNVNGLHVSVTQTSTFGDIDVFIGKDYYPSISHWEYKDTSTGTALSIQIEPAQAGTWYIGLYGYWSADYDIIIDVQSKYFYC